MSRINAFSIAVLCFTLVCWSAAQAQKLPQHGKSAARAKQKTDQERLDKFKTEVEQLSGKKVVIGLATTTYNGYTDCNDPGIFHIFLNPKRDDPSWRNVIIAHELGHAYLCAQGFHPARHRFTTSATEIMQQLLEEAAQQIGSCMVDPLADAQARKHGFEPSISNDRTTIERLPIPRDVLIDGNQAVGGLNGSYLALDTFCREARKHSFNEDAFESPRRVATNYSIILQTLKVNKKTFECDSSDSCYRTQLLLRNAAGFHGYIQFKNEKTQLWE